MSSRVATKISDASRDAELDAAKAEVAAATEEAAAMQASIAELTGTKAATEVRVAALERTIASINARLDAARAKEEAAVPRLQHELGLYVNISGIKWDTKAPEGTVRGRESRTPRARSIRSAVCVCVFWLWR
jgi:multidrug efflux pump subunit AcrA (membrane-fusion protein)